jgi:hypothetical protein
MDHRVKLESSLLLFFYVKLKTSSDGLGTKTT